MNSQLIIKTKIWENETLNLINYSNSDAKIMKMKIGASGILRRNEKTIYFTKGENQLESPNDLLSIKQNTQKGKYIIKFRNYSKDLNELVEEPGAFLVYRGFYSRKFVDSNCKYHKLHQGDIFKLGKIYFKVLDIYLNEESTLLNTNEEYNSNGSMSNNSSYSKIVNGQQVIKGSFSSYSRNKDINKLFYNSKSHFLNIKKACIIKNESYDSFIYKKKTILPKININNQLISIIKKKRYKIKNRSDKKNQGLILKKNNNIKTKNKTICRICYRDQSDDKDPLISPCICKGSMKYIHYKCLKNWLNSKIENDINNNNNDSDKINSITYKRKDISCELCKEILPDYIKHNNLYYNISFYKPKFKEFIVLESIQTINEEKIKYIHIISLDNKKTIIIGRDNECELSLNNLFISRYHCFISKRDGELFLEDNLSKYGTLVLIQNNNIIMSDLLPLKIQINNIYIKIKVSLPVSFRCCDNHGYQNSSELNSYNYQIQNKEKFNIFPYLNIKEDNVSSDEENKEESLNSNNISKLLIDDNNSDVNSNNGNKNKNKILQKENENKDNNSLLKFEMNSSHFSPRLRFKNLSIKKEGKNKFELPNFDSIKKDLFKDSASLNMSKISQIIFNSQYKTKAISLIKNTKNNRNKE